MSNQIASPRGRRCRRTPAAARLATLTAVAVTATLTACHTDPPTAPSPPHSELVATAARQPAQPSGKGIGVIGGMKASDRTRTAVDYHGGRLMTGATNIYFVWYGDWSARFATQNVLVDFATHLGGSSYFRINALYHDANAAGPSGDLVFGGTAVDAYSRGASLTDADMASIVEHATGTGQLPEDTRGLYVIFTSPDVAETSGFGTVYCGFHAAAVIDGLTLKLAYIGHPDRAPQQCEPQAVSPNGDAAADAMVSILAAELSNAVTDPELTAWYDRSGLEPADKCAWTYGATYATPNGAKANVHLGLRDYLLQQLWVPDKHTRCALTASSAGETLP